MNSNLKIVQPVGILNGIIANKLKSDITELIQNKVDIILLDLQNVTFMDSMALGALVSIQKIVNSHGGNFFICSPNESIQTIFKIKSMGRIFRIFANEEEFHDYFIIF